MTIETIKRLTGNYSQLANQYLDAIPVNATTDFKVIGTALKMLLIENRIESGDDELQESLESIQMLTPDLYADKDYHDLFVSTIKTRISAKIDEFSAYSESEKQKYIDDQETKREAAAQVKELFKRHSCPSEYSEKRTLTDEAFNLQESVRILDQESGYEVPGFITYQVSLEQWSALSTEERVTIMLRPQQLSKLIEAGYPFNRISRLPTNLAREVFLSPDSFKTLIDGGITPFQVDALLRRGVSIPSIANTDQSLREKISLCINFVLQQLDRKKSMESILTLLGSLDNQITALNDSQITFKDIGLKTLVEAVEFLKKPELNTATGENKVYCLNLSCYSNELTDESLKSISENFSGLVAINLNFCDKLTDESISKLAENCPHISSFSLARNKLVTSASIKKLAENGKLCEVFLDRCEGLDDQAIFSIAEESSHLENIFLGKNQNITKKVYEALAKGCRRLENIHILDGNNSFRDEEYSSFRKEYPLIKVHYKP